MILIVENIHLISIERMNVVKLGKPIDYFRKLFIDRCLGKFYLSHVEFSNTSNFELMMDLSWSLSVCFGQDNVNKSIAVWNGRDGSKVVRLHLIVIT